MSNSTRNTTTKQTSKSHYKLEDVNRALVGRAVDVLQNVAGISRELLDGNRHGCPDSSCGGNDEFQLIDAEKGAVSCNQCFHEKSSDVISAVMHYRRVRLPEALELIAQYLGLEATEATSQKQGYSNKRHRVGKRATKATRATSLKTEVATESPCERPPIETASTADSTHDEAPTADNITVDPTDIRHEIYSLVLSGLSLSDMDREALHRRGLSDAAIDAGEYRSVAPNSRTGRSSKLLRDWVCDDSRRLELARSVPGVVQYDGKPLQFKSPIGLLIPVRDASGKIIALRIRLDSANECSKDRWITSRTSKHPNQPSPGTPCHVPLGVTGRIETLRITIGELNADIAFRISGVPTVSIAGVNAWKRVLPLIDELNPKRVLIAIDADPRTNRAVAAAFGGIASSIAESREMAVETWDLRNGKGIDNLLAAGVSPTLVEGSDLMRLLAELPVSTNFDTSATGRVEILIGTDEHRVNDEAIAAMVTDNELFSRVGSLVRIVSEDTVHDGIMRSDGTKRIRIMRPQTLRESLTRRISFLEIRKSDGGEPELKPVHPPGWCVSAIDARGVWPGIRPLRAIVKCPLLRSDGSILSTNGYDLTTGLFLASTMELPPIPAKLTIDDAIRAAGVLLDVVADFPFARPEHRAAWLAYVLTSLARYAFSGPSPLFLIDANTRGSGKSLLADVGGVIATGATLARMSNPKDDEECRKRITALAIAGDSMVLIDNIAGHLGCASLDAALTSPDTWKDRILGKSEIVELPLSLTWAATGNNVMLEADTARRTLHIRLDSPDENPELRTGFRTPNLVSHVKEHRAELVAAGLTILSAYRTAGSPSMNLPAWGSFDSWSALIREAIVWCDLPDPGQTREELTKRSDVIAGVLNVLINQWSTVDPNDEGMTSAELLRCLEEKKSQCETIREAICELCCTSGDKLPTVRSLGNRLRGIRGRVSNGKALDSIDFHGKARWVVRPVKRPADSCSGGSSCSEPLPLETQSETMKLSEASVEWEDVA